MATNNTLKPCGTCGGTGCAKCGKDCKSLSHPQDCPDCRPDIPDDVVEAKRKAWVEYIETHAAGKYDTYENPNIEFSFAFDKGVEFGQFARPWVAVSERLPPGDVAKDLLVTCIGEFTERAYFVDGIFYAEDDDAEMNAEHFNEVVAWMPLPGPYKEQGKQE